jgi:hypothetical protein
VFDPSGKAKFTALDRVEHLTPLEL